MDRGLKPVVETGGGDWIAADCVVAVAAEAAVADVDVSAAGVVGVAVGVEAVCLEASLAGGS
jgi:hypothetical protein